MTISGLGVLRRLLESTGRALEAIEDRAESVSERVFELQFSCVNLLIWLFLLPAVIWRAGVGPHPDISNKPAWVKVFTSLAADAVVVCLATVVVILLVHVATSRFRSPVAFLAYHHSHADTVERLERSLRSWGIRATHLPFADRSHDETIHEVREQILSCDVVIALPGPEPSFLDAELLAASVERVPILLLSAASNPVLPDTALRGYPMFHLGRLEQRSFRPLAGFVRYVCNDIWETRRLLQRTVRATGTAGWALLRLVVSVLILVKPLQAIGFLVVGERWIHGILALDLGLLFVGAVLLCLCLILTLLHHRLAMAAARQESRGGGSTVEVLKLGLSQLDADREVLACLEERAVEPRHTLAPKVTTRRRRGVSRR